MLKDSQIRKAVDECMFTTGQIKRSGRSAICTHINECNGDSDVLKICLDTMNTQLPDVTKLLFSKTPESKSLTAVFSQPEHSEIIPEEMFRNIFGSLKDSEMIFNSENEMDLVSKNTISTKDIANIVENFKTYFP